MRHQTGRQVLRHHVEVEPEVKGRQVQAEPAAANQDRQQRAAPGVLARLGGVQADRRWRLARPGHQVEHEHDRRQVLGDAGQLQDQVQPVVLGERADQQGMLARPAISSVAASRSGKGMH